MRTANQNDRPPLSIPYPFVLVSKLGNWHLVAALVGLLLLLLLSTRTAPVLALKVVGTEVDSIQKTHDIGLGPTHKPNLPFTSSSRARSIVPELLVNYLQHANSPAERFITMSRLEQMGQAAVPTLISALADPNPDLRLSSSELLGWQRDKLAVGPLLAATFDSHSAVREAAVGALGEIADMEALPRVQQLQVSEGNYYVQQAAYMAEQQINSLIADQLGIGASELRAVAVSTSRHVAYAVTSQGLYERHEGTWSRLSNLPSAPSGVVATDPNGEIIFVGTLAGLYRSSDRGETWQSVQEQLPRGATARATAVTLNPQNSQQVFVALYDAAQKAGSAGVFASVDGGDTWRLLPDSPKNYVTTRLNFDPSPSPCLYGATGVGLWRYALIDN